MSEKLHSKKLQVMVLLMMVHELYALSTFSSPLLYSPTVPEPAPFSRASYLSQDEPSGKMSVFYTSIYETADMLSPGEEVKKIKAAPVLLWLTLYQGRHPGIVTTNTMNVALEYAAETDNLVQVITEDSQEKTIFLLGLEE